MLGEKLLFCERPTLGLARMLGGGNGGGGPEAPPGLCLTNQELLWRVSEVFPGAEPRALPQTISSAHAWTWQGPSPHPRPPPSALSQPKRRDPVKAQLSLITSRTILLHWLPAAKSSIRTPEDVVHQALNNPPPPLPTSHGCSSQTPLLHETLGPTLWHAGSLSLVSA